MKKSISILIVDDHPVLRDGLTRLLESEEDISIVGTAQNSEDAVRWVSKTKPDIAIVDICLEDELSGLFLIKALTKRFPETSVLVLSMYEESTYAVRSYKSGALGYVTKKIASEHIVEAIRTVSQGKLFFSPEVLEEIKNTKQKSLYDDDIVNTLTNRELEVYQLIGRGFSTIKIAGKLNLSKNTIDSHKRNIKQKLDLKNNNDLIKNAVQWLITGQKALDNEQSK